MLEEYLDADAHKNKSAGELRFVCVFLAENMTYLDSRGGDNKCRHADKRGGSPDIDLEKSECDSDCERVDACRYREDEHLCEFQLVAVVACGVALNIFFFEAFDEHLAAENEKKHESHPVVIALDLVGKARAEEITDYRHKSLEDAEIRADNRALPKARLFQAYALAYRDGERVH